jgi:hypothetical protein
MQRTAHKTWTLGSLTHCSGGLQNRLLRFLQVLWIALALMLVLHRKRVLVLILNLCHLRSPPPRLLVSHAINSMMLPFSPPLHFMNAPILIVANGFQLKTELGKRVMRFAFLVNEH